MDRQQLLQSIRENRLKSYSATPGDIEEHRRAEYRVAGDTAGRPLIELLQNADDAIQLGQSVTRKAVKIVLGSERLLVANDGDPFSLEGVEAICNLDRSPKKDRRITIGNKGIGFKSILLWTKDPSIYSTTFQFYFSKERSANEISEQVGKSFNRTYAEKEVPLMRLPFWAPPPSSETSQLLLEGFTTVIVLPLKSRHVCEEINRELEEFDELSLLFLNAISCLEIITLNQKRKFNIDGRQTENLHIDKDGVPESYRYFSIDLEISDNVRKSLPEDNQDLTHCRTTIALPKNPIKEHPKLFAYFPTAERAPFPLLINGDFVLDAGRKHLTDSATVYHRWMASSLADLLCEKSLPYLIEEHEQEAINFLFCRNVDDMENKEELIFAAFKEKLSETKFLPVMGNPTKRVAPQAAALVDGEKAEDVMSLFDKEIEFQGRFVVHPDWSFGTKIQTLERLGAKRFQKTEFIEIIGQNVQPESFWTGKVLNIILKWIEKTPQWNNKGGETQGSLLDVAARQKLFLTDKNRLRPLIGKNLPPLFILPSSKMLERPSFIKLNFLHPDLAKDFEGVDQKIFFKNLDLLSGKGLHKFHPLEVIKQAVLPVIEQSDEMELSKEDKKSLLRFLAQLGINEKKFEETEPYPWFDDIRRKLTEIIHVPTRNEHWCPGWKVYAGRDWGAKEALEHLYKDQPDRAFLANLEDPIHQNIDVETWKRLYRFIGVSWEPKILPFEKEPDYIWRSHFPNPHPSQISNVEWEQYHKYLCSHPDLSDMWKWSIQLKESYVLDGWNHIRRYTCQFIELAYTTDLFEYIVGDKKSKIDIGFRYTKISWSYSASCQSFIRWAIKNTPWLNLDDQVVNVPAEVFLTNSEIGQGLGEFASLIDLPAPNEKILFRRWEDLLDEIGIRRKWQQINLEDWQRWLENIPVRFPLNTEDEVSVIRGLYFECLKRCPSSGDKPLFSRLKVLAAEGSNCYRYEEANRVIYFDEPRFDSIKKRLHNEGLLLFPIELGGTERQKRAKLLFGMNPISEKISEKLLKGNEDQQKTEEWQLELNRIMPVLLARLSKDRPESRDRDKELMQSIKLTALNGLKRQFYIIQSDVFLSEERAVVCWSENCESNILFINLEGSGIKPWSSIADALAQRFGRTYYEAFKVLLACTSDEERIEELRHAGVSEDDIRSCEEIIKIRTPHGQQRINVDSDQFRGGTEILKSSNDISLQEGRQKIITVENGEIGPQIENVRQGEDKINLPTPTTGGTGGVASHRPDTSTKEEIEKEAMKWAIQFEEENSRKPKDVSLSNLGYDIESKDLKTGELRYIEVKGASGKPEKREITINEWRTAITLGDKYYIYYVLGLATDEGEIRIVKNPSMRLAPEEKTFNISILKSSADEIYPINKKQSDN